MLFRFVSSWLLEWNNIDIKVETRFCFVRSYPTLRQGGGFALLVAKTGCKKELTQVSVGPLPVSRLRTASTGRIYLRPLQADLCVSEEDFGRPFTWSFCLLIAFIWMAASIENVLIGVLHDQILKHGIVRYYCLDSVKIVVFSSVLFTKHWLKVFHYM